MLESGPNVRFFWVAMNSDYSSVSLARSWREGRISPDDLFEAKGKRLTFRQLCQSDPWLHSELGSFPDAPVPKKRSWFAERRFRRDAWRKVVDKGELGPAILAERIDRLAEELETVRSRHAETEKLLNAAQRREKDLLEAIRTCAEDIGELVTIFDTCARTRTVLAVGKNFETSQSRILANLASNLRKAFEDIASGSARVLRKPDTKRIEQIVLFHNEAIIRIEEDLKGLAEEKRKWTDELDSRKREVADSIQRAKNTIHDTEKAAELQLESYIRKYRQSAALHAKWRNLVEKSFLESPRMGERYIIGNPLEVRPDWVSRAIFSYAQTVPPEAVLGLFNGGFLDGSRFGFLVAWDGLHWKLNADCEPGFLPWGWNGKIVAERGLFFGAKIVLENGFTLGELLRAGPDGEIEAFLRCVAETNEKLPEPSLRNGGSESFRLISSLAIQVVDSIASREEPS